MRYIFEFIFTFMGILFLALLSMFAISLVLGFPIMLLWNRVLVNIVDVPIIGYWEAVFLYLLSSILIKSFNYNPIINNSDNN